MIAIECPRTRHFKGLGFTLVKLLVVIAIIGVLLGMSVPAMQNMREMSRRSNCEQNLTQLSLALSAYMLHGLSNARQAAVEGLDEAIAALDSFGEQGYQYEFALDQEIPISVDIPIEQEMTFPVEGTFPIDTTVEVPINAGILGTFVVEVPINTSIDVETSVPIQVEENFRIETTVPVSMTIPIEILPDDPAVSELLQGIRQWLEEVRDSL